MIFSEKELRKIFKNNFDCYVLDEGNEFYTYETMAMTEDKFIEVIKKITEKPTELKREEIIKDA